ncbi:MAG: hypothetical protein HQM10_19625 [Candidatus Riflebacteria bacterium]|nr:hypothetical protein [Candidatus Riflebacteria bacterium]
MILFKGPSRRGFAMILAIIVVELLLIYAFWNSNIARHAQYRTFKSERGLLLKQIAFSASDEAFCRLLQGTAGTHISGSDQTLFNWFINRETSRSIDTPLTTSWAKSYLRFSELLVITASVKHKIFRGNDRKKNLFYPKEGLGTFFLETIVKVIAPGTGGEETTCTLTRYYDYKVISQVTPRSNTSQRTFYAHNFTLDYALLIRNAFAEANSTNASSLNNSGVKMIIDQTAINVKERRGKVYLGDTANNNSYVFLNTTELTKPLHPSIPSQEIRRVNLDECIELFPQLEMYKDDIQNLQGIFELRYEPAEKVINTTATESIEFAERIARQEVLKCAVASGTNVFPGFEILGRDHGFLQNPGNANEIVEGNVRQRFFSFVNFVFDLDSIQQNQPPPDVLEELKRLMVNHPSVPMTSPPPKDSLLYNFAQGVEALNNRRTQNDPELISKFNSDFLYSSGMTGPSAPAQAIVTPNFFNIGNMQISSILSGPETGFQPYGHSDLVFHKIYDWSEAIKLGIYIPQQKLIKLHGIVSIKNGFNLGEGGGPVLIEGQGVLICQNGNIIISSGISKVNSDDICVLVARNGNVEVNTKETIEASLIAVNDNLNGAVVPLQNMKLKGALIADILETNRWAPGEHFLYYDKVLKRNDTIFQINISPVITFERLTESES